MKTDEEMDALWDMVKVDLADTDLNEIFCGMSPLKHDMLPKNLTAIAKRIDEARRAESWEAVAQLSQLVAMCASVAEEREELIRHQQTLIRALDANTERGR